jgi:hypothetical protein
MSAAPDCFKSRAGPRPLAGNLPSHSPARALIITELVRAASSRCVELPRDNSFLAESRK